MVFEKVAVVTGAGGGLGQALCTRLLREGYAVAGIVRSSGHESQLHSEKHLMVVADVSRFDEVSAAVDQVLTAFGRIDVLFNNAAEYPIRSFLDESPDEWMKVIATNLGGVVNCCKAVLPTMIEQERGIVFNVGSFADIAPIEGSSAYSTSKGGLHALTKSIARDLEPLNLEIRVHEWIPGHLRTRMSGYTGIDPSVSAEWAVELIKREDKRSCIYENNTEWHPPKGVKERIRDYIWKLLPTR